MKRIFMLVLLLAGVAFTLAACTSYPRHRYPYPDYRGGSYNGFGEVRAIADDLEEATDRLYDRAEDMSHHGGDREDYALDSLEDLRDEAGDFKDEVDDNRRDPRDTQDDYYQLMQAYNRAREAMRVLHAYDEVYRDFDRVARLMSELNRYYGYGQRRYGY